MDKTTSLTSVLIALIVACAALLGIKGCIDLESEKERIKESKANTCIKAGGWWIEDEELCVGVLDE